MDSGLEEIRVLASSERRSSSGLASLGPEAFKNHPQKREGSFWLRLQSGFFNTLWSHPLENEGLQNQRKCRIHEKSSTWFFNTVSRAFTVT
jgi:hypothetical protein